MRGSISEQEMWKLPFRRFCVYLRNACRVQAENYLNLLAIATNPHLFDARGKPNNQERLFREYELIAKGLNPEQHRQLKMEFLKEVALARLRKAKEKEQYK